MLSSIRLQSFRSYADASFEFSDGVNIIVGPNASGKTNLLEAILVLARGISYRASDYDLVGFGKPWARLDGDLDDGQRRTIKITRDGTKGNKNFIIDDKPFVRLGYNHTLPVVLFEPNHLLLLGGSPDARRQYMDDLLEQTVPGFGSVRRHYKRVLAQRNALLKRQPGDLKQQLFVWDVRLSELGGHIAHERAKLVTALNEQLAGLYTHIAGSKTVVTAAYQSSLPIDNYETTLLHHLEASLSRDVLRGFTGAGPHRDDMSVMFDAAPAPVTASRGETRTALLALKVFELGLLEKLRGQKPLLLLDDVFSELDGKRRHALTDYLQKYQTFITTTDADLIGKDFSKRARIILPS